MPCDTSLPSGYIRCTAWVGSNSARLTREVPSTNRLLEALAATVSAKVMSQPGTLPDARAQVFNHVPLHHGITGLGFACS